MKGSWHLGKMAGIEIRVHWTFLLLPVWVYGTSLLAGRGTAGALTAVLFILAVFGCVVLHELGHALAARGFGIATQDITLLPIGGLARLERMPRRPAQELIIAIAGPAVNVLIGSLLVGLLVLWGRGASVLGAADIGWGQAFLANLAWVNFYLVLFNLIPAFPMDGGRVLRAGLAMFLPYVQATRVAARVGQTVAILFGLIGLFTGQLMLILIGLFVYFAAAGESWYVAQHPFEDAGTTQATAFGGGDLPTLQPALNARWTANEAVRWVARQPESDFPVVDGNELIGSISKSELLQAVVAGCGQWPIHRLLSLRFLGHSPPCASTPHP